jgi:hypothetical protein
MKFTVSQTDHSNRGQIAIEKRPSNRLTIHPRFAVEANGIGRIGRSQYPVLFTDYGSGTDGVGDILGRLCELNHQYFQTLRLLLFSN